MSKKVKKVKKTKVVKKQPKQKTGFEVFSLRFLILCVIVCAFAFIYLKSIESAQNRKIQSLKKDIEAAKVEIKSLELEKQELSSFNRISGIVKEQGYVYHNTTTAKLTNQRDTSTEGDDQE